MSAHTEPPRSADAPPPPDTGEDAGRLGDAKPGRLIGILLMLVLFSEIVPLQYTLVGVIVPKIGTAFPSSGDSVTWVLTITGVVGGASLALVGKVADLMGKKRAMMGISLFFLVGSLICAVSTNWALFIVGRACQALSLGLPAIAYGMVRDLMPRRWIPVCVGFLGTGFGVAAVLAPVLGGVLTDHFSFRSIFWFLAIYTAATIPLFALLVPESPIRVRQRLDWLGAVLFGVGIAGVLIYLSEGESWGWTDAGCLAYLIGGVAALVAFALWEKRTENPIMELSLLLAPKVSLVMAASVFVTILLTLPNFVVPYMFQTPTEEELTQQIIGQAAAAQHLPVEVVAQFMHLRGDIGYAADFSVFELALHITLFTSVASMIFGPLGGYLARRVGARIPLIIGTLALLAAFLLWWKMHDTWQEQAFIGILWGLGFGFYYGAGPNLLMDAVPAERQGVSASMYAAFGAVGSALATALITPILAHHPLQIVATPPGAEPIVTDVPQVYTDAGYTNAYLFIGVVAAVISLLLALSLRNGRVPARGGAPEDETETVKD